MPATIISFLLVLMFVSPDTALGDKVEDIFSKAGEYTVKIKSELRIPFIEDTKGSSSGAGFVVDKKRGWIMTNAHVANYSPSEVTVAFREGEYSKAHRLYVDPYIDVAILKIPDGERLQQSRNAPLDCGDMPAVGHPVGAYGHPWGLWYTGTRGIISGKTSKFGEEVLQTDAPINVGNSGGPLISLRTGKIVGINAASIGEKDDQSTNFAVPMKHACRILKLLQAGQDPSPPDLRALFLEHLDDQGKLVVARIYPSPETIDLRRGDVITGVKGVPGGTVRNEGELIHMLRGRLQSVQLEINRNGTGRVLSGRILPVDRVTDRRGVYFSGVLFAETGYRDATEMDAPISIHHVEPGTSAEANEIRAWDLLYSIDGKPVEDLDALFTRVSVAQTQKQKVILILKRVSGLGDQAFDYLVRELAVEDLKWIGKSAGH